MQELSKLDKIPIKELLGVKECFQYKWKWSKFKDWKERMDGIVEI